MHMRDYIMLKALKDEKELLLGRVEDLNAKIREIEETCDHKYPDGISATVTGLISWECNICNRG